MRAPSVIQALLRKMDFTPSDAEIAAERANLPTALGQLHPPHFSVEERMTLYREIVEGIRSDYDEAKARRDDAEQMSQRVTYEMSQGHPWYERPSEAQRELGYWLDTVVRWQTLMDQMIEMRDYQQQTCTQDVAYVIHYRSVLEEHIQEQLAVALARAEGFLPARLAEADRERIAAALKRKIAAVVAKRKSVSARRLLRGLPLVVAGV